MAGVECAGLVLAILPVVVETAKVYKAGVDTIVDAVSISRHNDKLEEFYEDLWWELFMLDRQLRDVVYALPGLSDSSKADVLKAENLHRWTEDSTIASALRSFFSSKSDFLAFGEVMGKIVQLLAQLVETSRSALSRKEDQESMYFKLKAFEQERRSKTTNSTVTQRLRFWKKEKDRKTCLKALRTWNKRLTSLTEEARKEPNTTRDYANASIAPSPKMRELSRVVYRALARHWECKCSSPHQAKLCLKPIQANVKEDTAGDFSFLFAQSSAEDLAGAMLFEGTFRIRSTEEATKYECIPLKRICDALSRDVAPAALSFLIAHAKLTNDEPTVWQLRPEPRPSRSQSSMTPFVTLQSVLCSSQQLPLLARRKLAVILSRSLLDLHEGLWLGKDWSKQSITFFPESENTVDYQKPYITTDFNRTDQASPDFRLFHPNANILALGILLIEIQTGRAIETYRLPDDLTDGVDANANTDWTVANRVAKSLDDDCSLNYKEAVQACLDTPWAAAGQRVSLDDSVTRAGLFNDVVQPLEEELRHLFRERF